jgi:uncharacterized protein YndB with AHSA1/START domain
VNKATIIARADEPILIIERQFDASPEKLFAAITRKDLVAKWWIGPGYTTKVEELNATTGGSWNFVQTNSEGHQFHFRGVFHLVVPPSEGRAALIIQTTEYEGLAEPGHVGLQKVELISKEDGKTNLVSTGTFLNVEDRDMLIRNGMETGMQNSYNKLDEVLKDLEVQDINQ